MAIVIVENVRGSGEDKINCGWKKFWEEQKYPRKFFKCANLDCKHAADGCSRAKADAGSHVRKVNSLDTDVYIVPLCDKCNSSDNHARMRVNSEDLCKAPDETQKMIEEMLHLANKE